MSAWTTDEHRAEDLLLRDRIAGVDAVEDRRADEGAVGVGLGARARRGRAWRRPRRRGRSAARCGRARSHETTGPSSVASSMPSPTRSACGRLAQRRHQPVVRLADRDHHRARHAALAGRAEGGADDAVDGLVDHGVGHHDHVVLGAAERLDALAGLGRALVDDARDRRRADERDRVDARGARGCPRRPRGRR